MTLKRPIFRPLCLIVLVAFFYTTIVPVPAHAQLIILPNPGNRIGLSAAFTPAHLKGITIHKDNALRFDFLIHRGDLSSSPRDDAEKRHQYNKLIKYFLASLTIADKDQWVNLSPYEKDRIIEAGFGKTEMGRDLLGQDYLLKQITASLIYPEEGLGQKFWDKVYERAFKEYGTTDIPVNTFNKVWIIPDQAVVFESGNTAYILKSHLKVMLEEDYLALEKNRRQPGDMLRKPEGIATCPQAPCQANEGLTTKATQRNVPNALASQVVREIVLPALEKEVNEGKNFANLRQIYSAMILATWYKKALKDSLLGKIYADKNKVSGLSPTRGHVPEGAVSPSRLPSDPVMNVKATQSNEASDVDTIYQRYLQAFKKGVYNYIKEDEDKYTHQRIPRKYFSGGFDRAMMMSNNPNALTFVRADTADPSQLSNVREDVASLERVESTVAPASTDAAMSGAIPRIIGIKPADFKSDRAMLTTEELDQFGLTEEPATIQSPQFNGDWIVLLKYNFGDVSIRLNGGIYVGQELIPFNLSQRSDSDNEIVEKIRVLYQRVKKDVADNQVLVKFLEMAMAKFDNAARFGFDAPEHLPQVLMDQDVTLADPKDSTIVGTTKVSGIVVPLMIPGNYVRGMIINEKGKFIYVAKNDQGNLDLNFIDEVPLWLRSQALIYILRAIPFDQQLNQRFIKIWEQWKVFYAFEDVHEAYSALFNLYSGVVAQMPAGDLKLIINPPMRLRGDSIFILSIDKPANINSENVQHFFTGSSEFSEGEFNESTTPEALIKAIQMGSGIEIPVADTPIDTLNKLLEDQGLYRVMTERPGEVETLISRLEQGQLLSLLETKKLNRSLIEANYPFETPKRIFTQHVGVTLMEHLRISLFHRRSSFQLEMSTQENGLKIKMNIVDPPDAAMMGGWDGIRERMLNLWYPKLREVESIAAIMANQGYFELYNSKEGAGKIVKQLSNKNERVRVTAAAAIEMEKSLSLYRTAGISAILSEGLKSKSEIVQVISAEAIVFITNGLSKEANERIEFLLSKGKSEEVRVRAAGVVIDNKDKFPHLLDAAYTTLKSALTSKSLTVRVIAGAKIWAHRKDPYFLIHYTRYIADAGSVLKSGIENDSRLAARAVLAHLDGVIKFNKDELVPAAKKILLSGIGDKAMLGAEDPRGRRLLWSGIPLTIGQHDYSKEPPNEKPQAGPVANADVKPIARSKEISPIRGQREKRGDKAMTARLHHLSEDELALLRKGEVDEQKGGFISTRPRDDQRIIAQVIQIETALGRSMDEAEKKAAQVIADLNGGKFKFKDEEVHILNGTGQEARAIGRVDRNLAEQYGYVHETVTVTLITPSGNVILQLRNKDTYDDHLSMFGGHLGVGESYEAAAIAETKQEARLSSLDTVPIFVGYEPYDIAEDLNKERRSHFIIILNQREYQEIRANQRSEEDKFGKDSVTREEYKRRLFESQKNGSGEVVGIEEYSFSKISSADVAKNPKKNPNSPTSDKTNHFLPITDRFASHEETLEHAFFTPDALDRLLSPDNQKLWSDIQAVVEATLKERVATAAEARDKKIASEKRSEAMRHLRHGLDLFAGGNLKEAEKTFHEAIKTDPDYAETYVHLGILLLRKNDRTGARAAFEELRNKRSDDPNLNSYFAMVDRAQVSSAVPTGGIDLNAANLDLQIKRDGKGVPLPLPMQDLEKLKGIEGFVPVIINIVPLTTLPFLSELPNNIQILAKAS